MQVPGAPANGNGRSGPSDYDAIPLDHPLMPRPGDLIMAAAIMHAQGKFQTAMDTN